jgi:hypothetical protein
MNHCDLCNRETESSRTVLDLELHCLYLGSYPLLPPLKSCGHGVRLDVGRKY